MSYMIDSIGFVAPLAGGLGLVFALFLYFKNMGLSTGDQKMTAIGEEIHLGAMTFMSFRVQTTLCLCGDCLYTSLFYAPLQFGTHGHCFFIWSFGFGNSGLYRHEVGHPIQCPGRHCRQRGWDWPGPSCRLQRGSCYGTFSGFPGAYRFGGFLLFLGPIH